MKGIEQEDLRNFYKKFGEISEINITEPCKAIITFSNCQEAEFCLSM
jgi:RNA recognition motif-containing protein